MNSISKRKQKARWGGERVAKAASPEMKELWKCWVEVEAEPVQPEVSNPFLWIGSVARNISLSPGAQIKRK
jgi:hypothetical protein